MFVSLKNIQDLWRNEVKKYTSTQNSIDHIL